MFNRKEIIIILAITLVLGFLISLVETIEIFLYSLLTIFIIIMINIITKKVMSYYLDTEIEIKLWEINQYGVKAHHHFKKPFPAGAFLPIISKVIFFLIPKFIWMASLIFNVKPKVYKAAKRHGLYSFSEITEKEVGMIAAAGIVANLFAAIIAYLIGFPEFSRLSIFYAFFNMIPLSDLDGNKIFFGNIVLWSFLASFVLIGIIFTIFVI